MKTYEEACKSTFSIKKGTDHSVVSEHANNLVGRNLGLIKEIAESPFTNHMIDSYVETFTAQNSTMNVEELILSVFVQGVVVGMAMEKQEVNVEP